MAYRADDPAPLLPASVRHRLQGWLWKLLGFFVLVACAALSASLLTWSAADPSLTRATSGAARNLLGPPGAILSDMLIQMLGLAGVFVLLPPLFWAFSSSPASRPPGLRGKLVLAPLAVLFLAGALSSLPFGHRRGRCITDTAVCSAISASVCWRACSPTLMPIAPPRQRGCSASLPG
jgi:S-DNA-T family DNA segregation ATPase FtsK/SpoIIIE